MIVVQTTQEFFIAALNDNVILRKMTIADSVKLQEWVMSQKDDNDNVNVTEFMAMKVLCCLINEDGERMRFEYENGKEITDDAVKLKCLFECYEKDVIEELNAACLVINPPANQGEVSEKKS